MKYTTALGQEWISFVVVHRVISNVQPKRHCTGAGGGVRLIGTGPGVLLTPYQLVGAVCLHFF